MLVVVGPEVEAGAVAAVEEEEMAMEAGVVEAKAAVALVVGEQVVVVKAVVAMVEVILAAEDEKVLPVGGAATQAVVEVPEADLQE